MIRKLKKVFGLILIFFLIISLSLSNPAFASTNSSPNKVISKNKINDAKRKKELKKKKEKQKQKALKELAKRQKKLFGELTKITFEYNKAYTELMNLEKQSGENQKKLDISSIELDIKQENLNKRIVALYTNRQDVLLANLLLEITSFDDFISELKFLKVIAMQDAGLVKETKQLRKKVADRQQFLDNFKNQKLLAFKQVEQKADLMKRNLESQRLVSVLLSKDFWLLQKRNAVIGNYNISLVFPVQGPHSFSDDWGEPRADLPSGGHEGNDVFALTGTPVVAVTDGIISKASFVETGLGGIRLWLAGNDGISYYFAHLSKIAEGIKVGQPVTAGQLIGYVGNTGDARTTPPHLHFEMHPGGGVPIDPYLFLRAADIY